MKATFLTISIVLLGFFIVKAQVNLQTGAAEQNFPLINYTDSKAGLSIPIGLAYSSGNGLLVNDVPSDVGTGWNLDAGGIIIRVQNGEPDDQMEYNNGQFSAGVNDYYGVHNTLKNYPNGYMYNSHVGQGCNVGLNYYASFRNQSVYKDLNVVASDMEQDKFIFRISGHSGVFVIGRDRKVTILGDSRIRVVFTETDMTSQGIRTRISQFVITTEDGLKYTFAEKSLSKLCRYKYSGRNNAGVWYPINGNASADPYVVNRFWGYELGMDERPYVVNSWFLSQQENTNTGQKAIFNYQSISNDVVAAKLVSHQRDLNNSGKVRWLYANADRKRNGRAWLSLLLNPNTASAFSWDVSLLDRLDAGSTSLLYNRSIILSKRINSITLPNGGLVSFIYSAIPRIDLPGENALERISYTISGKLVRQYQLDYGYFFRTNIRPYTMPFNSYDAKFSRLCLLSIQKLGTGEDDAVEPPYKFSYYTGSSKSSDDIVPARNYLSQDHWGYFNGNNAGLSLNEDHDFLSDETNTYFKTVLPKYKNPKTGYARNGLLRSVTYPTGGSIEYSFEQIRPSHNIFPSNYEQLAGGVSVVKTQMFDGEDHQKDIIKEYNYKNAANQSTHWGDEAPSYTNLSVSEFNLKCFQGKSYKYPGLQFPEMATSIDWGKILGKALLSAGINAAVSAAMQALLAGTAALPIINIIVFVATLTKFVIDCTKTYEYHRLILSNMNNISINPLLSYYSKVEVRGNSPTGGYNGKTVYEFTDLNDFPALVPNFQWPYISNQRLASWVYGNPKKITVYDKNNLLVKESSSEYSYAVSSLTDPNNLNCKCATINKEALKSSDWSNNEKAYFTWNSHRWMTPRPYFDVTGRTDLTSISENLYTAGVLYASNTTGIIIDPMTLLQKGRVILKDPTSLVFQITYYPSDFNIPNSALEQLKQNNAIQVPVSTETWIIKIISTSPGFTLEMVSSNVTEFKKYTFGSRSEVKPYKTYELKAKSPLPYTLIGTHNPNLLIRNANYYKLQSEMTYDNDGNLVQTNSNENVVSFINDYSNRYVVASVANADFSDIAYSSFESNGQGNWSFNAAGIQSIIGLTGSKSYAVSSGNSIIKTGLNSSKSYTVTYWVKDGSGSPLAVSGGIPEFQYQANGWSLYSYNISGVSSVTLSGTALIDELRLFPAGSLMSTVCYKEGIGKSVECDANNRMLFYDYDGLGRLRLIKDQNQNIIKTYEYNYKQ